VSSKAEAAELRETAGSETNESYSPLLTRKPPSTNTLLSNLVHHQWVEMDKVGIMSASVEGLCRDANKSI
jgi:hypothetical protein